MALGFPVQLGLSKNEVRLLLAGRRPRAPLRHTAGSEFRRATGDLERIRLFMRQASTSTTSEHADERWKKE